MTRSADGSAVVPDRAAVLKALEAVVDPRTGQGLVSAGLVRGLALRPGRAGFMLEVACKDVAVYESVRTQAESALTKVINVAQAQVVLTTLDGPPSPPERSYAVHSHAPPARGAPGSALTGPAPPADPGLLEANEAQRSARGSAPSAERSGALKPPFVRQVIAVASGKGGVGKSTLAVNLAAAFAALGYRTGLLDADVYGPSVPRMLGLTEEPRVGPDKKLIPLQAFGIKAVSIGLLVKEGSPMIWRGPMASSALTQLLQDVAWGSAEEPLDLLIVDMPPGTGDIQLTLSQRVRLDGAVIVSTPQDVPKDRHADPRGD
jgi:ATP-binding protein involved in chromosome partitioning